jgi:hypothetical protein
MADSIYRSQNGFRVTLGIPSIRPISNASACTEAGEIASRATSASNASTTPCAHSNDPLTDMISPSLMGSNGVLPITIIAPVPDICRHMANLIVRAQKEVFLATNFWIYSGASRIITGAIQELSRRAGERGRRVVVKIMYDRGNVKQVVDNLQIMTVKQYTAPTVRLPFPEEMPNIDMEVQNYHRPMLGTFHSKFMVVAEQ